MYSDGSPASAPAIKNWVAIVVLPVPGLPSSKKRRERVSPPTVMSSKPRTPKFAFSLWSGTKSLLCCQRTASTQATAVTIQDSQDQCEATRPFSLRRLALRRSAAELVGQALALCCKRQTDRIDAVALARRRGPIWKHVTLVATASRADDFRPDHAIAGIANRLEVPFRERLGEARPAGSTLELRAAVKERKAAQPAGEDARTLLIQEDTAKRRFRAMLQEDMAFFVIEVGDEILELLVGRRSE